MHEPLNIPLEPLHATRHSRRVAPLYIAIFTGMLLGWLVYRAPWCISKTVEFRPNDTTASIRVLRTTETLHALQTREIGSLTLNGTPWTFAHLLGLADREMTVHTLTDGDMAITVDVSINQTLRDEVAAFGYTAHEHRGMTLLAPTSVTAITNSGSNVVASALLPGHAGEIHTTNKTVTFSLNKKGLTLQGAGYRAAKQSSLLPVAHADVLAAVNLPADLLAFPATNANALGTPTEQLINLLVTHGGALLLTKDQQGTGYFLRMDPQNMSVENVASIGKDLINHRHLSTRTLTTEDGEKFSELFGNNDALDISIQTEQDFTFITITNTQGDTLRLAKTTNLLTIANRDIQLDHAEKIRSACALRAHSWITQDAFTTLTSNFVVNHVGIQKIAHRAFSEIAITNNDIRVCW